MRRRSKLQIENIPMFRLPGRSGGDDADASSQQQQAQQEQLQQRRQQQQTQQPEQQAQQEQSAARQHRGSLDAEGGVGRHKRATPVHSGPTMDWRWVLQQARLAAEQELSLQPSLSEQQAEQPLPRQQQQQQADVHPMLVDRFSRRHTYLRISLTERCNLRCTYCMPAEGVDLTPASRLLTADEILRIARLLAEGGVNKIRLTGGEPTVRRDLVDVVRRLRSLPGISTVGITSNGIALARLLPELSAAGLNALNVSLDTLRPERFAALARREGGVPRVLAALQAAQDAGFDPVKLNVVLMRGVNDDEVADFVRLTVDRPINVRFIEYMPFDGNVWSDNKMVPFREMKALVDAAVEEICREQGRLSGSARADGSAEGVQPGGVRAQGGGRGGGGGGGGHLARLADPAGEVAKNFSVPGWRGSVSFVTSMTEHFCGDCNRLRLLADGSLKVCLFGASELSLRDAMRSGASDDDLRLIVHAALQRKQHKHAGMATLAATGNRPMITIGG